MRIIILSITSISKRLEQRIREIGSVFLLVVDKWFVLRYIRVMNYQDDLYNIASHLMELEAFFHGTFIYHFPLEGKKKTTMQRYRILKIVGRSGPQNLTQLCDRLRVKKNSMSELLDRMIKDGLLEREISREDRRKTFFRLLPAGERSIREFEEHLFSGVSRALDALSPEDAETFIVSLKNIIKVSGKMRGLLEEKES